MGKRKKTYYVKKYNKVRKGCCKRVPFKDIENLQSHASSEHRDDKDDESESFITVPEENLDVYSEHGDDKENESDSFKTLPQENLDVYSEHGVDKENDSASFIILPEEKSEEEITVEGNRIMDFQYMFEQLKEISHHNSPLGCNLSTLSLRKKIRKGFISKFSFVCKMCGITLRLNNCKDPRDLNLNDMVVSSFMSIGSGYAGLEEVSSSLAIPCMADSVYSKCHAKICELWELAKQKCMEEAAKEEYELAIQNGDVDENGVPMIVVVADACWSKRSYKKNYNALSGAAVIIGYRTKKVLYMAVKNKYCMMCARAQNKDLEAPKHVCFKNFNGSSSSMESTAIVEGFKRSIETQGLIYYRLIADGDSSTYKKILDARPYGNIIVEKIECSNHLLRNFSTKLDDLTRNTAYPIGQRKLLTKNTLRLRRAVKEAVKHAVQDSKTFDEKVLDLKEDLRNTACHVFGDHTSCKPYFCTKNTTEDAENNFVPDMKKSLFFEAIQKITYRLVNNAKSLVFNLNSNIAEVFNSIIAKFIGVKRINYSLRQSYAGRCAGSVVSFNSKHPTTYLYKKILHKSPNKLVKRLEMKRNIKRLKSATARRTLYTSQIRKQCATNKDVDSDYGENCQRPDMTADDYAFAKSEHINKITLTEQQRDQLEKKTILQNDSIEWHQERRLRLTASVFGKICKRGLVKCAPLVKNLVSDSDKLTHVKSIRYGIEHEQIALSQLVAHLQNINPETFSPIKKCGLFIDPTLPYLGASPDGLFQKDKIVEIKCPYSAAGMSIDEGIKLKKITFWKQSESDLAVNKRHDWYYQAQGQLHITRRSVCIFTVWTDVDMKIEFIERDDNFWNTNMRDQLSKFYFDCLLPELIDSRIERKMEIKEPHYILEAIENKIKIKDRKEQERKEKELKRKINNSESRNQKNQKKKKIHFDSEETAL